MHRSWFFIGDSNWLIFFFTIKWADSDIGYWFFFFFFTQMYLLFICSITKLNHLKLEATKHFNHEVDCIILRFKAKTEWFDFSFVELCYIKHTRRLHVTKTADGLNENVNSLSASRWHLWNSRNIAFP